MFDANRVERTLWFTFWVVVQFVMLLRVPPPCGRPCILCIRVRLPYMVRMMCIGWGALVCVRS